MKEDCKSCRTCFFTEEFPGVVIGENGRCNYCSSKTVENKQKELTPSNLDKLKKVANELKANKKGKYDCIIGGSGGLDSSYVLYVAKKILGLNPLVVRFDHGFTYDVAPQNIEELCKLLNVDLVVLKSKEGNDFKYIQNMAKGLKEIDSYWGGCSFCHYILPTVVYKYALKENISTILCSVNLYEWWLYLERKEKIKFMYKKLSQLKVSQFFKLVFYVLKAQYYLFKLKLEFYILPFTNLFKREPNIPQGINKLNITEYVEWDIYKMVTELKEMGWNVPDDPMLPMRFDCKIEDGLINRTFQNACGCTVHGIICNNMIYGKLNKKEDLERTYEFYKDKVEARKQEVLEKLRID